MDLRYPKSRRKRASGDMPSAHAYESQVRQRLIDARGELDVLRIEEKQADAHALAAERELQRIRDRIQLLKERKVKT